MWRKNPLRSPVLPFSGPRRDQCRLHGGAPGSGAPCGERNGNWKGGRYSRLATPEQRRQAWQEYWAAKRAQNTALADIPDISEELKTLWLQS
jgi:hypothetical protein